MGNNHSNDYRPDPTRADRIRGGSGDKERTYIVIKTEIRFTCP